MFIQVCMMIKWPQACLELVFMWRMLISLCLNSHQFTLVCRVCTCYFTLIWLPRKRERISGIHIQHAYIACCHFCVLLSSLILTLYCINWITIHYHLLLMAILRYFIVFKFWKILLQCRLEIFFFFLCRGPLSYEDIFRLNTH